MFFKKMRLEIKELWDIVRRQQKEIENLRETNSTYIELPINYLLRGKFVYNQDVLRLILEKLNLKIKYAPKEIKSEFILTEKDKEV